MSNRPISVKISDALIASFLKPAHINRSNAEALFIEAGAVEFLPLPEDPEGKSIIIAERHIKGRMSEVHLLGMGFFMPPDSAIAHMILRIPPALRNDVIEPLETLKRILDAFGATVSIGEHSEKLIIGERVEIAAGSTGNLVRVSAEPSRLIHNGTYIRMTKVDGRNYADCALCFALDMTSYLQSISH